MAVPGDGPTGSGKTTTALLDLQGHLHAELKMLTIEDPSNTSWPAWRKFRCVPVEISPSPTAALDSPSGSDVVTVGEIRDSETAEIAIRRR